MERRTQTGTALDTHSLCTIWRISFCVSDCDWLLPKASPALLVLTVLQLFILLSCDVPSFIYPLLFVLMFHIFPGPIEEEVPVSHTEENNIQRRRKKVAMIMLNSPSMTFDIVQRLVPRNYVCIYGSMMGGGVSGYIIEICIVNESRHILWLCWFTASHPPSSHICLSYRVWPHATLRYCADGAANRLYECTAQEVQAVIETPKKTKNETGIEVEIQMPTERQRQSHIQKNDTSFSHGSGLHGSGNYIPDVICGDLDSLHPHVRTYYKYAAVLHLLFYNVAVRCVMQPCLVIFIYVLQSLRHYSQRARHSIAAGQGSRQ